MKQPITLKAVFALLIIVLGNMQAWDSNIHDGRF
jgi:hypothetical protein